MSTPPVVKFENEDSARSLTDQEIEDRLASGAVISNTAMSIRQAKARPGFGTRAAYAKPKFARQVQAIHGLTARRAVEVSDPSLDRSDETAIAINPAIRTTLSRARPPSTARSSPTAPTSASTAGTHGER